MVARRVRSNSSAQTLQRSAAADLATITRTGKCIIFSNFVEAIDSVSNSLSEALLQYGPHPRNCADGGACNFMRFTSNVRSASLRSNSLRSSMQERIAALKLFRLPITKVQILAIRWYKSTKVQKY